MVSDGGATLSIFITSIVVILFYLEPASLTNSDFSRRIVTCRCELVTMENRLNAGWHT